VVEHADRRYTLRAKSIFNRIFVLLDGAGEVGSIAPVSIFSRRASVDLPEELPLPVRIFLVWPCG
jgi:hypothetical protein